MDEFYPEIVASTVDQTPRLQTPRLQIHVSAPDGIKRVEQDDRDAIIELLDRLWPAARELFLIELER